MDVSLKKYLLKLFSYFKNLFLSILLFNVSFLTPITSFRFLPVTSIDLVVSSFCKANGIK